MKNLPLKYAIILAVVIIALIGVIVWQSSKINPVSQNRPVVGQIAQTTQTSSQQNPVVGAKVTLVNKTNPNLSYTDYVAQLNANKMKCDSVATTQYGQLYAAMLNSSFVSYYNQNNGGCFMNVTGKTQDQYSTSTIGHLYFRNVNTSTVIVECTDPTGTLGEGNWVCKNKSTGATINKAQFDALVTSYLSAK